MGELRRVYGRNYSVYGRSRQSKRLFMAVYGRCNHWPGLFYEKKDLSYNNS